MSLPEIIYVVWRCLNRVLHDYANLKVIRNAGLSRKCVSHDLIVEIFQHFHQFFVGFSKLVHSANTLK